MNFVAPNHNIGGTLEEMESKNSGSKIAVLICCIDPRIRGTVDDAVEQELGVKCFKLTAPGASQRLLDPVAREVMMSDVKFALENWAEIVVLCHHGAGCAAYGDNQGQQTSDMITAAHLLRERFSVSVVLCMQDNPEEPHLRVIGRFLA
ncbi:MAG: hypothetical protein BWY19_00725 [bacterium ADurb.Bin212]|nr:MAG: hypothetical protein BWY19_00725 [bacterium ADurb.Bin212]